jgi:hypothetical protein
LYKWCMTLCIVIWFFFILVSLVWESSGLKTLFHRVGHNYLFAAIVHLPKFHVFAAVVRLSKFCVFSSVVHLPKFRAFATVCRDGAPGLDLLHKVGRTCLFIYMLNVKIHGVAHGTRPVACVLGPEGLIPITHGWMALFWTNSKY